MITEILLDDDSGSEFEGFTLEDIREMGDIDDDSFEQDFDKIHKHCSLFVCLFIYFSTKQNNN